MKSSIVHLVLGLASTVLFFSLSESGFSKYVWGLVAGAIIMSFYYEHKDG